MLSPFFLVLYLIDMYLGLISHLTSELTYAAEVAELEYSIDVSYRGLTLTVQGFSHKIHVLIITDAVATVFILWVFSDAVQKFDRSHCQL